ncbi:hypothetical protein ANN_26747 [Periplaneta americana]|uniref:DUF4817 domain-containing protein n=1 Tax=Periplaneta americana TaxID=6978 RepID=A0ABQ8RZ26_PERAM|nr:hypothetical protein ANN_26747 [Periplaneta americana]
MTAIDSSSSFVPYLLQCDVIDATGPVSIELCSPQEEVGDRSGERAGYYSGLWRRQLWFVYMLRQRTHNTRRVRTLVVFRFVSLPSKETLRGHSDSSFRGEGYIQCCVGVRLCDMYSNQELAEIHFMYGKADCNAALARRLYQERYPQRQCPDRKTFIRLHYRLCEYGKFNSPGLGRGRPRSTTPEVQEEILEAVNMTPISTRRVALQVNVPHTTVWRLLKEYQLYPYHLQRVRVLSPADYPARIRFCQWFLQQCGVIRTFLLFTDESRDGGIKISTISMYGRMKTHVQLFHLITRCGSPSTCGPVSLVID